MVVIKDISRAEQPYHGINIIRNVLLIFDNETCIYHHEITIPYDRVMDTPVTDGGSLIECGEQIIVPCTKNPFLVVQLGPKIKITINIQLRPNRKQLEMK